MLLQSFSLGPIGTNCYIVGDSITKQAVVIDPGGDAPVVIEAVKAMGVELQAIWLTHAHFDHFGGVAGLVRALKLPVAIHSHDLPLYYELGGAKRWNIPFEPGPEPAILLDGLEDRAVGNLTFNVFHVPGHALGHVAFYLKDENILFGGDVLFKGSVGRTDLPGGNHELLIESIQNHFLTLPDNTIVYSGHGPETTIGDERRTNPFL
jgi:hydroxyacylglutathione hydrolase